MNFQKRPGTKPKYRPQNEEPFPDVLINFELTQENMQHFHQKNIFCNEMVKISSQLNLINDDDLVYSDNQAETCSDKRSSSQANECKVLSDCINIQKSNSEQQYGPKNIKYRQPLMHLDLQSKIKTKQEVCEQSISKNKSSCFLTNKSVFFTNHTNQSIAPSHSINFKIKPKISLRNIVESSYKTERLRKAE